MDKKNFLQLDSYETKSIGEDNRRLDTLQWIDEKSREVRHTDPEGVFCYITTGDFRKTTLLKFDTTADMDAELDELVSDSKEDPQVITLPDNV